MDVISKDDFVQNLSRYTQRILDGQIFIHPTDTIYGVGCDATNSKAVLHVREAKARYTNAFSVIAPSKEWICENCVVPRHADEWLDKLPGPYTFIFFLKKKFAVAPEVNPTSGTLGVRIPAHWFSKVAQELNRPLVTTSANIVGKNFMTSPDDLDPEVAKHIHFLINEGEKAGKPSTIVDLTEGVKILER